MTIIGWTWNSWYESYRLIPKVSKKEFHSKLILICCSAFKKNYNLRIPLVLVQQEQGRQVPQEVQVQVQEGVGEEEKVQEVQVVQVDQEVLGVQDEGEREDGKDTVL